MSNQPCFDPLPDIETTRVDELHSLQLQRMQASLGHSYANSPAYKAKFDEYGRHLGFHCDGFHPARNTSNN